MRTLISNNDFENLRLAFKSKDETVIRSLSIDLFGHFLNSNYLDGKLGYHPLGFIYAKILTFENGDTFRIHIWNNNSMLVKPVMDIHNHFYDVNSFVCSGTIANNVYRVIPHQKPSHSIYEGSYFGDKRILTKTDFTASLELINSQKIENGRLYTILQNEIHSGGVYNSLDAITLVLTDNSANPSPVIYGPLLGSMKYEFEPVKVTDELSEVIKRQIRNVSNSSW